MSKEFTYDHNFNNLNRAHLEEDPLGEVVLQMIDTWYNLIKDRKISGTKIDFGVVQKFLKKGSEMRFYSLDSGSLWVWAQLQNQLSKVWPKFCANFIDIMLKVIPDWNPITQAYLIPNIPIHHAPPIPISVNVNRDPPPSENPTASLILKDIEGDDPQFDIDAQQYFDYQQDLCNDLSDSIFSPLQDDSDLPLFILST